MADFLQVTTPDAGSWAVSLELIAQHRAQAILGDAIARDDLARQLEQPETLIEWARVMVPGLTLAAYIALEAPDTNLVPLRQIARDWDQGICGCALQSDPYVSSLNLDWVLQLRDRGTST